jgi:hypothetical protein
LIVLRRRPHGRVRLTNHDRWFFILLYRWFPSILQVLTIIRPETLVRWHRLGFRCNWRWKSRPRGGRPKIETDRQRSRLICCRRTRFSASNVALALKREARIARISLNRSAIRMRAYAVRLLLHAESNFRYTQLALKRQITARLRKGLPLQGSSLPFSGFEFSVHIRSVGRSRTRRQRLAARILRFVQD